MCHDLLLIGQVIDLGTYHYRFFDPLLSIEVVLQDLSPLLRSLVIQLLVIATSKHHSELIWEVSHRLLIVQEILISILSLPTLKPATVELLTEGPSVRKG